MNALDRCKHLPDYPILAVNCFACTRDYLVELESRLSAAEKDLRDMRNEWESACERSQCSEALRQEAEADRDAALKRAETAELRLKEFESWARFVVDGQLIEDESRRAAYRRGFRALLEAEAAGRGSGGDR